MYNNLCIFSYNSRGFNKSKQEFLSSLTAVAGDCLPVICNQENFLLKSNEYIAKNALPDYHVIFNPATMEDLNGRPKNGMFVAVPDPVKEMVKDVSPPSKRLQSLLFRFESCRMLLLNTYFPTDPKTNNFDDTELRLLLSQIQSAIAENDFDQLIITGDINADFKRSTSFVKSVEDFLAEFNIRKSWDAFPIDFTHVMEMQGKTYTSILDHFFWIDAKTAHIIDSGVIHSIENTSDHCPIYLKLEIPKISHVPRKDESDARPLPRWNMATDEQKQRYMREVDRRLQQIGIPKCAVGCNNVRCYNKDHMEAIDSLMLNVLQAVEKAADIYIPKPKNGHQKSKEIPNWKEEIQPFRDKAQFWHAVWESAGRPIKCELHNIMKRSRNVYHLHIRKNKRLLDRVKRNALLTACLENKTDLFDTIKRRTKRAYVTTMDGQTENIPDHLASTYKNLYNSTEDEEKLTSIEKIVEMKIYDSCWDDINRITWNTLRDSAQKLKGKKSDPFLEISSDYLSNAPDSLYQMLSIVFKSYISHGHVSEFLLLSTLIPIIKNKMGDITSSDNYRSIAISSLILKIFDNVILSTFSENLQLDELQFGYQTQVSTSMCTWLAVETIEYFNRNGSDVYTCLMDMSKAFDTVRHSLLFQKLLDHGLPSVIVRFLMVTYKLQRANVKWNNDTSEFFAITNGVKQGAVLSAVLYCVYTNGLFQELRRSNVGCSIGQNYVGAVGYADDIFLLSPSLDGLQRMLQICEEYAVCHNLKFSTNAVPAKSKTKCLAFCLKERTLPSLKLRGNDLPWVSTGKHLGIKITNNQRNLIGQDIMEKRAQFIQRTNELSQEFAYASCDTKCQINRIYNSHFTGSVLWDLSRKESNMVYNTWSVSIRKMFRLDRTTHRYLIEPISGIQHIKISFMKRFLKFADTLASTRKEAVKTVYNTLARDCRSTTGRNVRRINLTCESSHPSGEEIERQPFAEIPHGEEWRAGIAKDLINIRDGLCEHSNWTREEAIYGLLHVCTT